MQVHDRQTYGDPAVRRLITLYLLTAAVVLAALLAK